MIEPHVQAGIDGQSAGALGSLRVATLADRCHERLKAAIISLELRPMAELSETQLAEMLGISKSPVREALARLTGEGFVTAHPGRKCRVAALSADTITEVYKVRMLLEPASLHEVAPSLTPKDFDRLRGFIENDAASVDSGDRHGVVAMSEGFHSLLIERSGNQYLCRLARQLFDRANRIRFAIYFAERQTAHLELSQLGLENHRAILAALEQGQGGRAADLLRNDIAMFLGAATAPELQRAFEKLAVNPGVGRI